MLTNLHVDVILHILRRLHVTDILSLRKTSRHLNSITRLRTVWYNALLCIQANNIPITRIPHLIDENGKNIPRSLSSLSSQKLENLVRSTISSSENWERDRPVRTRAIQMRARVGRVFMLHFLRICSAYGRIGGIDEGRYLFSFGHTSIPTLCIQVWDTESNVEQNNTVQPIAEWSANGRAIGVTIDNGNGLHEWALANPGETEVDGALIAVSARIFTVPADVTFDFRIVHFTPSSPSGGRLSVLKAFPLRGPLNVRAMYGGLIAVQVRADGEGQVFGHGSLKIVDWVRSSEINAQENFGSSGHANLGSKGEVAVTLEPSTHGTNRSVLCVHISHDWILVFRESILEMYFVPPSTVGRVSTIRPNASHKWNWQINTLAVTERVSWLHDQAASHCSICNGQGFVYASTFAEAFYLAIGDPIVCSCRYRPLSVAVRFDSYFPWPVNLLHHFVLHVNPKYDVLRLGTIVSPYVLPLTLIHTVPSTVRLFAKSVIMMGNYGTLLWTDSETHGPAISEGVEPYFMEGKGERVAGRRLPLPAIREEELASLNADTSTNMMTTVQPDELEGKMMNSPLFGLSREEGWNAVAMCEQAGRIAIGDGEGNIEVWDHF